MMHQKFREAYIYAYVYIYIYTYVIHMYTLFFSVGKAVINRIVGHWKGGDITLKAIPTTKPIFFPSSFSW